MARSWYLKQEVVLFSILEIIDIAIQLEKNGEKLYRQAIHLGANDELKKLLAWMADEEHRHAEWFANLKKEAEEDEDDLFDQEMSRALIDQFIREQVFSLRDINFVNVKSVDELFPIFIEFEEDTFLFYEMLKAFLHKEEDTKMLERIMNEEKSHIKKLQELQATFH